MKVVNIDSLGIGLFLIGIAGIGYAMYSAHKMDTIASKLDRSIDSLSDATDIDIQETMVKEAVSKTVDREVSKEVKLASSLAVSAVKTDIHEEVRVAVRDAYNNIRDAVNEQIETQIGNISIESARNEVIAKAKERAAEKFEQDLDAVLEKYNDHLDDISKIYGSIAKTISRNDGKEMRFSFA